MTKSTVALIISLHILVYSSINAYAQCDPCDLPVEGKVTLIYSRGGASVLLEDTQIKKLMEFKQFIYDPPYISGQVHTGLFKRWDLVEIASVEKLDAAMTAIADSGKDIRIFRLRPRNQAKDQTIADRITKKDLDSFNFLLRSDGVLINDPLRAYEASLLFLKLATHRVRWFFIEPISASSDIPNPTDKTRRFDGILSEPGDEKAQQKFRDEIEQLSRKLDAPKFAKVSRQYKLRFFTWDAAFGRVEEWCFTISRSRIINVTQKLVADRI
jgi:hypothetical protein